MKLKLLIILFYYLICIEIEKCSSNKSSKLCYCSNGILNWEYPTHTCKNSCHENNFICYQTSEKFKPLVCSSHDLVASAALDSAYKQDLRCHRLKNTLDNCIRYSSLTECFECEDKYWWEITKCVKIYPESKTSTDKIIDDKAKTITESSIKSNMMLQSLFSETIFGDTNVYIYEHNWQGTKGFILNTPTSDSIANAMMKSVGLDIDHQKYKDFKNVSYKVGGPVSLEKKFYLHNIIDIKNKIKLSDGIFLSDKMDLRILSSLKDDEYVYVLHGNSQWYPGQLQQEIDRGSWITYDMESDMIFHDAMRKEVKHFVKWKN